MVCTVLRVFAQTYTDQHCAHVHTHTLQVNDTLRSSVSASRWCLPLSTEHHWDISMPLPWEPHLGSQTSPSTFQYLSPNICMADWLYKHTYWKPYFLIPFVTVFVFCFFFLEPHTRILSNTHHYHPFLCDPMAHPLWGTPSLFQKLHLSKVLLLLSTLV